MNYPKLLNLLDVALALSLGVVGCTPKKGPVTHIPAAQTKTLGGTETFPLQPGIGNQLPPDQPTTVKPGPGGEFPLEGRFDPDKMNQDRQRLAANTVYFEFDRATIK